MRGRGRLVRPDRMSKRCALIAAFCVQTPQPQDQATRSELKVGGKADPCGLQTYATNKAPGAAATAAPLSARRDSARGTLLC